jgi:CheY-like chemotaxis protein
MPGRSTTGEGRLIVLVVEDDESIRDSLVEYLESSGYGVAAVADGHEAVEALLGGLEPDLVVLDLVMPRMDGWAVLKWFKADSRYADRPVLVMSATVTDRPTSASAWLPKPFHADEFRRVVAQLCGR